MKKLSDNLKHQDHARLSKNEVRKLMRIKIRTEKSFDWPDANFLKSLNSPLHVAYFGCQLPLQTIDCLQSTYKKMDVKSNCLPQLLNLPVLLLRIHSLLSPYSLKFPGARKVAKNQDFRQLTNQAKKQISLYHFR